MHLRVFTYLSFNLFLILKEHTVNNHHPQLLKV